jgi:hypothetical protein
MTLTRVVNLRKEPFDVYIGRPGQGEAGPFGNPIRAGESCPECREFHAFPGATLECFERYFLRRVAADLPFREQVMALKGKTLGCFCTPPNPCHGQVIVAFLDGTPRPSVAPRPQLDLFGSCPKTPKASDRQMNDLVQALDDLDHDDPWVHDPDMESR